MTKAALFGAAAVVAAVLTASAEDFPLKFQTIPAKDVMAFPGGAGAFGQLRLAKPTKLKKEPQAISRHPLYGECRETTAGPAFVFRLDESKGDGKGYDQLLVDMNENGDLTDETPAARVVLPNERPAATSSFEQSLFGPIQAPASKLIANGRPIYFAQVYVYNRQMLRSGNAQPNLFIGQIRFKAGWYLDTTVQMGSLKRRVGVFDGDSNLRLGDIARPQTYRPSAGAESWYFPVADSLLVAADGSATFQADALQSVACPFGPILYLGATPYQVSLAADFTTLHLEPFKEELAEVALQPRGDQVYSVLLAWERPSGDWQLIRPGVAGGKIKVPPGSYRLYQCRLLGKGPNAADQVLLSASESSPKKPFNFLAGKANTLVCGGRLQVNVAAEKRKWEPQDQPYTTADRSAADSDQVLTLNAHVTGAQGEAYSGFLKGERFNERPPQPTFTVLDAGGKKVGAGALEYG